MKKIYIDTLGCEKNTYDSQVLAAKLTERGCIVVSEPIEADIYIVNTCGFIDDAKKESIARIFELAGIKDIGKKLIVTGCLSQRYHKELVKEMPEVDMFFGVNEYETVVDFITKEDAFFSKEERQNNIAADMVSNIEDSLGYKERIFGDDAYSGVLKIAEGCNNMCSFCAIPMIRGSFRSKRMEDCIKEAEDMSRVGIKELIVIAQDISQYGIDIYNTFMLPELLKKLCRIEGIEWIRLMYVYDNGITDELIEVMANEDKICKYIDIPIQHISDNVLQSMGRKSSGDSIKKTIRKLRNRVPGIHIRTTLLVGFPGEKEEDIEELIYFLETYKIDRVGVFAYSDEEGTSAFNMDGKLDDYTKQSRRNAVMEVQISISEELNKRKIGKTYDVIVDEVLDGNVYIGRTEYDAPDVDCEVTFSGKREHSQGDIVRVMINNAYEYDIEGEEIL